MKKNSNEYLDFGKETFLVLKNDIVAIVSTSCLPLIQHYTWCREGTGYLMSRTYGHAVKLHRLVIGAKKGEYVDHIDGDKINNTLSNLRICTKQQNEFNQKLRTDNTTGYRGVSYHRQSNKYRACINIGGKQIHLGLFESPHEAARAYNLKAVELYGEYARINNLFKYKGANPPQNHIKQIDNMRAHYGKRTSAKG